MSRRLNLARDQTRVLYQAVNMFISAVWHFNMEIDSVLEPASGGHSKKCSFLALPHWLHLRLPLGIHDVSDHFHTALNKDSMILYTFYYHAIICHMAHVSAHNALE